MCPLYGAAKAPRRGGWAKSTPTVPLTWVVCQADGYIRIMEASVTSGHPVLHYLAVIRAARDFGLDPEQLEPYTLRWCPSRHPVDEFAAAVADAVLIDRL